MKCGVVVPKAKTCHIAVTEIIALTMRIMFLSEVTDGIKTKALSWALTAAG